MRWRERIPAARERGGFTDEDRALASRWATCAVGECAAGLSDFSAVPLRIPSPLILPGTAFLETVQDDEFSDAEDWLTRIEDRVLELKREHGTSA
jgi:hypothetical protein